MIARSHDVGEPRWSPSGARAGWLDSWDSRTDLVISPGDASAPPSVVTASFPVIGAGGYGGAAWCWLDDDRVVVAGADGRLVVLAADGGGVLTVLSRDGSAFAPAASHDRTQVAFCLERDDSCDIAIVPSDGSQWPQRASTGADYSWDPAWSASGALAWHEWDLPGMSWDASRIVVRAGVGVGDGDARVVAGGDEVGVGQPRFSPDGTRLAYVSDETGWWNVWVRDSTPAGRGRARPLRREPHDAAAPAWGPGERTFAWSPDGESIAWNRNELGFGRLVVATVGARAEPRAVGRAFHESLDWGAAGILAVRSGARTPSQVVAVDPAAPAPRRVLARGAVAGFEAHGLAEPEAVSWKSGRAIVHGLLYRPDVAGGSPPPLLVELHGGPTSQRRVEWNPRVAYWVSRGWAVLQVNYRGSTGYGRDYWKALEHHWGDVDVTDAASGIRHAGRAGWCDPARVAVLGGSAGGFTVLLVCARHPELVRAGVNLFGVADLLNDETHRFESRYNERLVGVLPRDVERYRASSPMTVADQIRVPLLVLQGSADKVVPQAHSDAIVDAMRRAGAEVEYHVYEGEGHGFRKLDNIIDEYERTERFLTKWVLRQ
jgi:dipeptidyl aminopeptidase/acylaminoacyl peptidase